MIEFLQKLFEGNTRPSTKQLLSKLKIGDEIIIELEQSDENVTEVLVKGNDIYNKKLAVEVEWLNGGENGVPKKETYILHYNHPAFKNFTLLNPDGPKVKEEEHLDVPFAVGTWVRAKSNGCIRYVIRHINEDWFEDDGKESGLAPSNRCYYENYEKI